MQIKRRLNWITWWETCLNFFEFSSSHNVCKYIQRQAEVENVCPRISSSRRAKFPRHSCVVCDVGVKGLTFTIKRE